MEIPNQRRGLAAGEHSGAPHRIRTWERDRGQKSCDAREQPFEAAAIPTSQVLVVPHPRLLQIFFEGIRQKSLSGASRDRRPHYPMKVLPPYGVDALSPERPCGYLRSSLRDRDKVATTARTHRAVSEKLSQRQLRADLAFQHEVRLPRVVGPHDDVQPPAACMRLLHQTFPSLPTPYRHAAGPAEQAEDAGSLKRFRRREAGLKRPD